MGLTPLQRRELYHGLAVPFLVQYHWDSQFAGSRRKGERRARARGVGEDDGAGRTRAGQAEGVDGARDLAADLRGGERVVAAHLAEVEHEPLAGGDHEAEREGVCEHVECALCRGSARVAGPHIGLLGWGIVVWDSRLRRLPWGREGCEVG